MVMEVQWVVVSVGGYIFSLILLETSIVAGGLTLESESH